LKKEFSRSIKGFSRFIEEVEAYLDLEQLSKNNTPIEYDKKELIFMEGSTANSLYFIESGTIKTYKTTQKGKELVTGLYSSGDFIGQLSLLTENGSYIESASVIESAVLYEIPKLDFTKLIHANKEVSNKFISLISNNLVEVQEQLVNMAYGTVRLRVARALLDLHNKGMLIKNEGEGISIAREDFAGLVGTATETSIRMLMEFKDEGLISIGSNKKIIIENKKALEDIAIYN
jgi:CRP-like cAMP-binding protein